MLQSIEEVFERIAYRLQILTICSSTGQEQTIKTTAEHPMHVMGKGWVAAGELEAGDKLQEPDGGIATITSIGRESHPVLKAGLRWRWVW